MCIVSQGHAAEFSYYVTYRNGEKCRYRQGLLREILPGGTKTDYCPLACGILVETCIACLCSNQNIDLQYQYNL